MGPNFGCDEESSRQKTKHFYVTTIMMALFSLLISFVVDEYSGRVEKLLDQAHISKTMSAFLQAARQSIWALACICFCTFSS